MITALGETEAYPDLVIADYRLAHEEIGTDVVARLRHELGLPIPALVISGDSSAETLDTAAPIGHGFSAEAGLARRELKAQALRLCLPAHSEKRPARR